ncbi:MAG: PQQ-dependent sugar dehydrogenase, partial [Chloroflexota bacterium]|nr:PQQ-dependent sugar dehydrogenase [Chloroflexota bacterium]
MTLLAAFAALLVLPAKAGALGLQKVGDFDQPIFLTSDPSNADRLFVVEREGRIKLVAGGTTKAFADITSAVRCCESERGLFSVALSPDFPQTGLLYVFYTGEDGPGNLHVAELRASGDNAPAGTLRNLLTIPHASFGNHNGGQLQFGPDGHLYAGTGDGGGNLSANAQNTGNLLGKVLRIDPRPSGGLPYSVPSSNPFAGPVPGADEIWAYGLRNPWRFSFDRATGDLLVADVGGSAQEELDFASSSAGLGRGANYGWDCREGFGTGPSNSPVCPGLTGYTNPVFTYATHVGGTCAITGGYVARDPSLGDVVGRYLYADLCLGQIRSVVPGLPAVADRSEGVSVQQPVSFGEDACGRLYVVEGATEVFHLTGSGSPACRVLTVSKRGQGIVTGPGIKCPPDCTQVFPLPERVALKATARKRASFSRWRRACSGKRSCSVIMNADRTVAARFRGPLKTRVKLTAADRSVSAGARASLRVKAKPCKGRRHDRVQLLRNGKKVAAKRL